jgi:hypothetical protein
VFVLEWLFGAVIGYALMLLLLGLYVVVRGVPAEWLGLGSQKERGPPYGEWLEGREPHDAPSPPTFSSSFTVRSRNP